MSKETREELRKLKQHFLQKGLPEGIILVSNEDEIRDIVQQELAALQAQIKHSQAVLASLGTKAKLPFPAPVQMHRTTQTIQQDSQPRSLECVVIKKLSHVQQEWCGHELASSCPAIVSTVSIAVQTDICKHKISLPEIDLNADSEPTNGHDFFLPPISPLDIKVPDMRPLTSSSSSSFEPRSHDLDLDIYRSCRKLSVLPEEEIVEVPASPNLMMFGGTHQAHSFDSYLQPSATTSAGPVRQLSDPTPHQNITIQPRVSTRRPLQILQTPQAQYFHFPDSFETDSGLESKPTGSRSSPGDSEDRITSPTYGILQDTASQLVTYSPTLAIQNLEVPPLHFFSPTPDTSPFKTPPEGISTVQTPEYCSTPHSEISDARKKSLESMSDTLSFQTLSDTSPGNVNNPTTSPNFSPEPDYQAEQSDVEKTTVVSDLSAPSKLKVKPLHSMLSVLMDSSSKTPIPSGLPSEELTRVPSRRRLTRSLVRVSSQTPLELVEFREPLPVLPASSTANIESAVSSESSKVTTSELHSTEIMKSEQKDIKEPAPMKRSMSEVGDGARTAGKTLLSSQSFPSLSDHVLRQLGLWLEENQSSVSDSEPQSEKDVENNFMALVLAFQTDRLTLTSRLELQNRLRDQAEQNMANEIQQLQNTVMKMCDKDERMSDFQTYIDALHKAALRVSSVAEMYGAVQQENRLSKAVDVILRHVENLKQAYHKEKAEHVETKRALSENKPANNAQVTVKPSCRRRATIAVGVAQNGTNLTHDTMTYINPLEAKLPSTTGRTRPSRHSLSQRDSFGKMEILLSTENQIESTLVSGIERRASLTMNSTACQSIENGCYECCSDAQADSDVANDSDGSAQDEPSPPTFKKNQQSFMFRAQWPSISWSTDEIILHARYGLAAVLLVAAVAVFCSSLYI
ncbi:uncharacterized protein LOC142319896 [Lycorma delicatula]|uniref:uncharacterized protein LOC142319896 n=1 Tax=Lycorma delicatula TaxID=130591 RepID=UPI003F50DF28